MKIMTLHKRGLSCACGCKAELPNGHWAFVNKMNGKYYKLHCARIYRLHTGVMRWIKSKFL